MEIESIAIICLVILVVLIIQIIVSLRLLLQLHHHVHARDEEHDMQSNPVRPGSVPIQENARPPSRNDAEGLTVPGPAYPSSSRYSVRTDISDSSSHYAAYNSTKNIERQASHSDMKYECGNPFADDALSKTKKKKDLCKDYGVRDRETVDGVLVRETNAEADRCRTGG
ncbi:hypothetical protein BKA58DRAFT_402959 [Alternaria rosae]|uniref:uncharacterized protein n=1 Tax=Alternaria rosae TaxID=1187941 RepID=UPI001E8CFCF1|nr:uncharacterized protein BKA58DRAFT_402959 [Alternaria rosae]KAH6868606.1 hypothetical protein BKA58DRAFT_402959 [Alternaria rosae]